MIDQIKYLGKSSLCVSRDVSLLCYLIFRAFVFALREQGCFYIADYIYDREDVRSA